MKGLLRKDWYVTIDRFKMYLAVTAVFWGMQLLGEQNLFMICYPCLLVGMVPTSLLGVDESTKWSQFCDTLPVSRSQVVSGKYLLGLIFHAMVILPTLLVQAGYRVYSGTFTWSGYLAIACIMVISSLLSSAVSLPLMFKFGTEKGRMYQYVTLGVFGSGSALLSYAPFGQGANPALPLPAVACAAAVTVALYILSWFLSIRFYQTREL